MFVDGRYTLQAPEQVDVTVLTPLSLSTNRPPAGSSAIWDRAAGSATIRGCIRPRPSSASGGPAKRAGGELVALELQPHRRDLGRPPRRARSAPVTRHPPRLRGERVAREDRAAARSSLNAVDALVISDAHNVAWLFNIRGADVAHTPLPLAFAYRPARRNARRCSSTARKLSSRCARVCRRSPTSTSPTACSPIRRRARRRRRKRLAFDAATAPARLDPGASRRRAAQAAIGADPITLMKAAKNAAELAGARAAHLARRRRADAFPRLVRPRGAEGRAHRDRRGGGAGDVPPRDRRS